MDIEKIQDALWRLYQEKDSSQTRDYHTVITCFGTWVDSKYPGLGDKITVRSSDGSAVDLTCEAQAIVNDVLSSMGDKDIARGAIVSYFKRSLSNAITDYFRSKKKKGFSRKVNECLSKDSEYVFARKKMGSLLNTLWGGLRWENLETVPTCTWPSIYGNASPQPLWEVLPPEKMRNKEMKESQIICFYALYLMEIAGLPQYMAFWLLYEVIHNEFQILDMVGEGGLSASHDDKNISSIDTIPVKSKSVHFDPLVVRMDVESSIPDITDQFILYCSASGYPVADIEKWMEKLPEQCGILKRKRTYIA
ncbi:MAG: hypothetical protein ACLFTW_15825, partial [Chitinispirillaceae bacterium]